MPASLKHSTVLRAVTRGGGGGGEGKEGGQKNYGVRILPVTHAIGCSGGPPRNPTPQPKHIPIPRPSAPPALARITLIAVFLVLVSVSHDDTLANTATHALPECISSPHVHPHTTEYPGPPTIDPITNLQSPTPVTNTLHTSLCRVGARGAVGACGCRCRCRSRHAILASCTQRPRARGGTCMCSRSNVRHGIKRNEIDRPLGFGV